MLEVKKIRKQKIQSYFGTGIDFLSTLLLFSKFNPIGHLEIF